jgi:predicted Rossmann fold nucleotide-binding protein DprA/Smf involved in DNA uptake
MTRIGVTGHQNIPAEARDTVYRLALEALTASPAPIAISSLAAGADQIVATAALAAGGSLALVVPCAHYRTTLTGDDLDRYDKLSVHAVDIEQLPFDEPSEAAFMAAGKRVVDLSDHLLAVWDGRPAAGYGGTADVVAYAREQGRPVTVIWPPGVVR